MDIEQLREWDNNPVTIFYRETLKEILKDLNETPRYFPTVNIGNTQTPITADFCAMQNAHTQGRIESLKEIIDLNLEKTL